MVTYLPHHASKNTALVVHPKESAVPQWRSNCEKFLSLKQAERRPRLSVIGSHETLSAYSEAAGFRATFDGHVN